MSDVWVISSEMHKTIATQIFEFKTHGSSLFSYTNFLNKKEKDRIFLWRQGGMTGAKRIYPRWKIRSENI